MTLNQPRPLSHRHVPDPQKLQESTCIVCSYLICFFCCVVIGNKYSIYSLNIRFLFFLLDLLSHHVTHFLEVLPMRSQAAHVCSPVEQALCEPEEGGPQGEAQPHRPRNPLSSSGHMWSLGSDVKESAITQTGQGLRPHPARPPTRPGSSGGNGMVPRGLGFFLCRTRDRIG